MLDPDQRERGGKPRVVGKSKPVRSGIRSGSRDSDRMAIITVPRPLGYSAGMSTGVMETRSECVRSERFSKENSLSGGRVPDGRRRETKLFSVESKGFDDGAL
jgi:hypothetical protein